MSCTCGHGFAGHAPDCPETAVIAQRYREMFPDDEVTEVIADPEAHMRELDAAYDASTR